MKFVILLLYDVLSFHNLCILGTILLLPHYSIPAQKDLLPQVLLLHNA